MEMTSRVMRFALATYFMKRGSSRPYQSLDETYESNVATNCFKCEEEKSEDVDSEFSDVVSMHVSNMRQLLENERMQDWSNGIDELREYVAVNNRLGSLLVVLVNMIKRQEEDAVCIVQVIEDLCFERNREPSQVFDELVELLFDALSYCCENQEDADVAIWLLRAVDAVVRGLRQYQEQRYGVASGRQLKDLVEKLLQYSRLTGEHGAGYAAAVKTEG